jgi:hypothetical protein
LDSHALMSFVRSVRINNNHLRDLFISLPNKTQVFVVIFLALLSLARFMKFRIPYARKWSFLLSNSYYFILLIILFLFPERVAFCQQSNLINSNTLETVNSFYGRWCCASDGYLYGMDVKELTYVVRKTENGQAIERRGYVTSVDPSFTIEYKMYATSKPGMLFILVRNPSFNYYLLKSTDGAATFRNVYTFGEGNGELGTNAANVRILRGILELATDIPGGGGKGTLYLAEYNVNHFRVDGAVNDRVRIMKSVDQGDTWTKVVEWNTNGFNQVGHIHAMKQDPYTGEIYICAGDNYNKAGIIKWDGSSAWADNKTLSEIGRMSGFKVLTGAQRYRVTDVLFDNNNFYTFADTQLPNNPTGSESGIWIGKKNFSSYTRVDNTIFDYDPMHIGWFGEKIGNTFIFTTSREYVDPAYAWKKINTLVYTSTDGTHWQASGVINWRDQGIPDLTRYIYSVFTYNNKLYIDCVGGAGHSSTIQCAMTGHRKTYDEPSILHPVFYVGNWNASGNDSNSGTNPDAPKQTLNNMLTSNRISAGSRVRIASGNYSEPEIHPLWSGAGLQGRGSVVIEGSGMNETHIVRSSGSGNTYGIYLEAARTLTDSNTPLLLKDLDLYLTVDGGTTHSNYVLYNKDSYIKSTGCKIGNKANDDSPLIMLADAGSKYVSENSYHIAASAPGIFKSIVQAGPNTSYHFRNCILLNAYNAFANNFPGIDFSIKNCTLYGIENNGVLFESAWNTIPVIKNCIFSCQEMPIKALSGLTKTDIDYNLYNKPISSGLDGGHSLPFGTDPQFVDANSWNFNLKSSSTIAGHGIYIADVFYDIVSNERKNPPCIGAYENSALAVTPNDITLHEEEGSSAEMIISSNINWNVSANDGWLNLSSLAGSGDGTIQATAISPNTSQNSRSIDLTFSGNDVNPVIIKIIQAGETPVYDNDISNEPILIYPNPVSGILNVKYNDDSYKSIYILNSKGMILKKEKTTASFQQFDFSQYGDGLYVIEFADSNGEMKKIKVVNQSK